MSALTQYLNVYRDSAPRFDANSAPALNALRPAALSALESAGRLPDRTDEGFEKTSVEEMFAPDFGLNPDRVAIAADIAATFRCDVPNLSSLLGLVVNDRFVPSATLLKNLPQGVTVCSLRRAAGDGVGRIAGEHTRKGGFARTVGPHYGVYLARMNLKVDAAEYLLILHFGAEAAHFQ